jgi:putative PIN family toxin of toxin-antitoxin system
MRVVLDTNILVSAMGWDGNEREVLLATFSDDIDMVLSEELIAELLRVLSYEKLSHLPVDKISKFVEIMMETAIIIDTTSQFSVIKEDPSDDRVLECAVDGCAEYIVSGNRHLLNLKEYEGIRILNAKEFLGLMK